MSAFATAALIVLTAGQASASPEAPTASALGFNIFTAGNATLTNNETEGPVAIGGNLTIGGNYQVAGNSTGTFFAPNETVPSALVIGGQVNFAASQPFRLQVLSGAYAKVGNLNNADVLINDGNGAQVNTRIVANNAAYESVPRVELTVRQPVASVGPTSPIDFAAAFADFRSSSVSLAGCTNNVILTNAQGEALPPTLPPNTNAFINLTPNVTNVLNITAANLNNIDILTFQPTQPSANTPMLINVNTGPGNVFNWKVPNQAGTSGVHAPFMFWNFPTATAITQVANSATLEGTLYAPNASLTDVSAANNEGQVIVASLVMGPDGGEVHPFPFTATLNCSGLPTPSIVTDASPDVTRSGSISDTATLTGGANPTGSITFNLYGPNNITCSGTPVFTSTIPVIAGTSSYTSASYVPTQVGTYRWVAVYSGDANNNDASTACNDPNESVAITEAIATPTLVTDASDDVTLGGSVTDSAILAGGQNPTGSIIFRLYGPNDPTCTGPSIVSTRPVNGNGTYTSDIATPSQVGTYQWVAGYGGDALNNPAVTACNDPAEAVTVTSNVVTPTLTTVASDDIVLGGSVTDTANLGGGLNPIGVLTFTLYGPNDPDCTGVPATTSTRIVIGNRSYTSDAFTPTQAGTYQWVASYSGDADNNPVTTACDDPAESVVVTTTPATPSITTDASPDITLGGSITDTANLADGDSPTGSITFDLYGPNNATCAGQPIFSTQTSVNGNGPYTSAPFTPTQVGTYQWIATYSGDANNAPADTACGDPAEQVVVKNKKKHKSFWDMCFDAPWFGHDLVDWLPGLPFGGWFKP
ncbi:choice-of-anchor A family protein [Rhizocola hellebori]|uniref:choice-of-anchor A family protein n=1 Tax=Rhizocola hellebori TaxID=1392758 RepID=UPI0019458511|nr:choice-of-anchor A family protein [Rhizocola hellebori]